MEAPDRYQPLLRPNFEARLVQIWLLLLGLGLAGAALGSLGGYAPALFVLMAGIRVLIWSPAALMRHRRARRLVKSHFRTLAPGHLADWVLNHPEELFLGEGFEWNARHAQWAHELATAGHAHSSGGRSPWIHNLCDQKGEIRQPLRDTAGHTLLIGTTGSGKTRCFDLLITQAILRGEAVVILDPKGDHDLRAHAARAAIRSPRIRPFRVFHPALPDESTRIDPLGSFNRPSELASRIASAMPGNGPNDPFRAFGQRAVDQIIQGFLFIETRPTLLEIRRILESGVESLLEQALIRHFLKVEGRAWKVRVRGSTASKPGPLTLITLIRHYRETLRARAPENAIDGLLAFYDHDRVHFGKMIASLLPVLNLLTTGPLARLISPDAGDLDDPRPITDLAGVIERGEILYIGLDALSDGQAAAVLASLLLSDLAATAGDRYNRAEPCAPVQVFIDEAAEAVNDAAIQLLNKGRGAGFRLTLATQTLADFTARLGSEAKAYQILGNVNTVIAFRVTDPETQRYVTGHLPLTRQKRIQRSQGLSTVARSPEDITGSHSQQLIEETVERFPPELLGQLPDLHYLGKLAGGRIVKGLIPLIEEGPDG